MCVLSDGLKGLQAWSLLLFEWEIASFSKNYVTSEGTVSHNVLYYQQLSIARVCLVITKYFEELPIVYSDSKDLSPDISLLKLMIKRLV